MGVKEIKGLADEQYRITWRYVEEVYRSNVDTHIEVMYTSFREPRCNPRFRRFYCSFSPLKKGFKSGCRPIIGLDGCHTKGPYPRNYEQQLGLIPTIDGGLLLEQLLKRKEENNGTGS
ncbi:hypothetical protein ACH5RR_001253 [Cinchona calisaya]|uniref:Uncharacterized protein n=1 Tax=Cinchona calisaya TaxID=153742 RepID=A0ABD3B2V9_9GENT